MVEDDADTIRIIAPSGNGTLCIDHDDFPGDSDYEQTADDSD